MDAEVDIDMAVSTNEGLRFPWIDMRQVLSCSVGMILWSRMAVSSNLGSLNRGLGLLLRGFGAEIRQV